MRRFIMVIVLILTVTPLSAEYLFLTDGSIIEGRVVSETPGEVTFRSDEDNVVRRYPREEVIRVHYTEMSFNRIYLELHSGEGMGVFLVGEDRHSYTFRHELSSPEEFTVQRSDVLAVSERNPSGLRGEPGFDEIRLAWRPPREQMRRYRIYIRKQSEDEFTRAAAASGRSSMYRISGLDGNTKYYLRITGVDHSGEETPAGSTIEVTTLDPDDQRARPEFTIEIEYHFGRLTFTPAVIFPLGEFGEMASTGYGGFVSFVHTGFIFRNFAAGIEAGYFNFSGEDSSAYEGSAVDSLGIIPFGIRLCYLFRVAGNLIVTPSVTAGAAYFDMTYTAFDIARGRVVEKTKGGFDPMVAASLSADWDLSSRFFAGVRGGYGQLFEHGDALSFISIGLNMGMRF